MNQGIERACSRATAPVEWDRPQATFWVAPEYQGHFERLGLTTVERVLESTEGVCLRRLADRENWRWELPGASQPVSAYVKKHHARRSRWRRLDRASSVMPAGVFEARRIVELAERGLTAMRLIAFGAQEGRADRSFVITEELAGYEPLDDFLRGHFSPRPGGAGRDARLEALLTAVAQAASRFHRAGYNHRDFYCCHFFVRQRAADRFDVSLIDLQRVERRRWRRRWIVKDLAQLAYSAPRERLSCTDRLRFLLRYLGIARLRPCDRRLARAVLAKQWAMDRKVP